MNNPFSLKINDDVFKNDGFLDYQKEVMQNVIKSIISKQEEFILSVYKEQEGFTEINPTECGATRVTNESGILLGTDYYFRGKKILTVFPDELKQEDYSFKVSFNYQKH